MSHSTVDPQDPAATVAEADAEERGGPWLPLDVAAGLALGGLALFFWGNAGTVSNKDYSWLFPVILSVTMGLIAAILLIRGLITRRQPVRLAAVERDTAVNVTGFALVAVIYAVLIPHIGFWTCTLLVISLASLVMSERKNLRSILTSFAIGTAVAVVGYLVLADIFYIRFPEGFIGW